MPGVHLQLSPVNSPHFFSAVEMHIHPVYLLATPMR